MNQPILRIDDPSRPVWRKVLRRGVEVEIPGAVSAAGLLTDILGLDPEYVRDRVRTVFVNSRPVDDLGGTRVRRGDVVGLGAAMPGMVGITMGRDSPLAVFREDISGGEWAAGSAGGRVVVKLFNAVAEEAGPAVLRRGAFVPARRLAEVMDEIPEAAASGSGRPATPEDVAQWSEQGLDVLLVCQE